MMRNLKRTTTVLVVLILALLFVSSVAAAGPAVKSKENKQGLHKVHVEVDIYKFGEIDSYDTYGKVDYKFQETTHDDNKIKFKLDLKHASKNTVYDLHLWANIPDLPLTIYGDLSNMYWFGFEYIFVGYGYDLDGAVNGKIETSLGILEISGPHVRDTMYDIETDKLGNYKCKNKEYLTQEELIENAIDFSWPYIRQHMVGLLPVLEPYLPVDSDFSAIGITSVIIHGGTYSVSTMLFFIGLYEYDMYYTEPYSYDCTIDDIVWTV